MFSTLIKSRDVVPLVEDLKLLMTCRNTSLDASTKQSFDNVIHFLAMHDHVWQHNKCCISMNCSIAKSVATKTRSKYFVETYEEELEVDLLIAIGARVMLLETLGQM